MISPLGPVHSPASELADGICDEVIRRLVATHPRLATVLTLALVAGEDEVPSLARMLTREESEFGLIVAGIVLDELAPGAGQVC